MSIDYDRVRQAAQEIVWRKRDEQYRRLVEIMEALPVQTGQHENLGKLAEFLIIHSGLMSVNDAPHAIHVGTKQIEKELLKLRQLTKRLVLHIDGLHRPTLDAISKQKPRRHPRVLAEDLISLSMACWPCIKEIRGGPQTPKMGARPKRRAELVTSEIAKVYTELTGKPARVSHADNKATGPFLRFLTAIFKALEIDASPEAQAKKLWEKTRSV